MKNYSKPPRKVEDWEISDYQGLGGKAQRLKAQSRKRRQIRLQESSMWDNLAPKEYHGVLNFVYCAIFLVGMIAVVLASVL
jgi:hypothetical protein